VTPFSGVLTDLQYHELERINTEQHPESGDESTKSPSPYEDHRRIDFHWMVRDKNNLLWFSDLLNQVSRAQEHDHSHLDIRIQTYVTQKRKQISQHVFRWLSRSTAQTIIRSLPSLDSSILRTLDGRISL
jgi:dual oxidase